MNQSFNVGEASVALASVVGEIEVFGSVLAAGDTTVSGCGWEGGCANAGDPSMETVVGESFRKTTGADEVVTSVVGVVVLSGEVVIDRPNF